MKERIIGFLRAENKSSAQFAEEIGVQPSGISHIISGRNNPSLDFILKMLDRYKYLSSDWLLFGKGTMYKDSGGMKSLFDQPDNEKIPSADVSTSERSKPDEASVGSGQESFTMPEIERIIIFYSDNSFDEYKSRR